MAEKLVTKNDLLNKLRAYNNTPDDENILYKKKIEKALLSNPCLLYALNEKTLESELFDDNGNINWEWIIRVLFLQTHVLLVRKWLKSTLLMRKRKPNLINNIEGCYYCPLIIFKEMNK